MTSIIDDAEGFVRRLATVLTRPAAGECLCCYVARMLDEFSCDGAGSHARRYRDARAPRATALEQRLSRLGAYCDCELFLNGYEPRADIAPPDGAGFALGRRCAGVRRASMQPCANWVRIRRG